MLKSPVQRGGGISYFSGFMKPIPDKLKQITGVDLQACYQCGKCTAGCPVAGRMDLRSAHFFNQIFTLWRKE